MYKQFGYCLPIMFSIVNNVVVFDCLLLPADAAAAAVVAVAVGAVGLGMFVFVSSPSSSCSPLNASYVTISRLASGGLKALGECSSSCRALAASCALCAVLLEQGLSASVSLASLKLGRRCTPRASLLNRLLNPNDTDRYCRCSSVMRSE